MNSRVKTLVIFAAVVALVGATAVAAEKQSSLSALDLAFNPEKPEVPFAFMTANAPMQGGEDCAGATVIAALPYEDSGTTTGYAHNYDEECPYTGSTAPDVVYSYTPAVSGPVDINLCVPGTNTDYDTKVFVYENTCPTVAPSGTYFGCNDDACSSPLYSNYVSQISALNMIAGNTYYIVIDGYGGSFGNYTLSVAGGTPPACGSFDCAGYTDVVFGQCSHAVDAGWSAATSGQTTAFEYVVAENVPNADYNVTDLHFHGMALQYNSGWFACPDINTMTFDIDFYGDAGGMPDDGNVLCSYTGVVPSVVAGDNYAGYDSYEFSVDPLPANCDLTGAGAQVWIAAQSQDPTNNCTFLWMSSEEFYSYDTDSYQWNAGVWGATGFSRGICLTAAATSQGTLDGYLTYEPDLMATNPAGFAIDAVETTTMMAYNTATDAMAYWTMDVPPGTYDVTASAADWLGGTYLGAIVADGMTTTLPSPMLLGGDFDDSGDVGVVDVTYAASRYGGGDLTADINRNGAVDLVDITSTASHYAATAPVPWP